MTCPVCHHPTVHDLVNPGPEWGPTHRSCFVRVDMESEALELAELAVPLPDPDCSGGDLTGRRLGKLLVLGYVRRWDREAWRVRCDCGHASIIETSSLRRGAHQCQNCARREVAYAVSTMVGGERLADLARRAGLGRETVRKRLKAGWPLERLLAPPDPRRQPKNPPRRQAA